jgi:hypothetical protein
VSEGQGHRRKLYEAALRQRDREKLEACVSAAKDSIHALRRSFNDSSPVDEQLAIAEALLNLRLLRQKKFDETDAGGVKLVDGATARPPRPSEDVSDTDS